jgi:hypothetical protein
MLRGDHVLMAAIVIVSLVWSGLLLKAMEMAGIGSNRMVAEQQVFH